MQCASPRWALVAIGAGKGLQWAAGFGPNGAGLDLWRLRDWMLEEAAELESAVADINPKLTADADCVLLIVTPDRRPGSRQ